MAARKSSNGGVSLETFYAEMMQMEQRRNAQSDQLEQRLSGKIDTLAAALGNLPRSSEVQELRKDLEKLKDSDRKWAGFTGVVSVVASSIIGFLTGQGK